MTFGRATDRDEARRIFATYREAGGNFIDTAVNYAGGASEEIVGELLGAERDHFVVATKYTAPLRPGDPNSGGNQAKSLRQALDTSLRRLRTDYIDLYWVHAWDHTTPLPELVRALDDVVRSGKVLHVGVSNTPAWAVARAVTLAEQGTLARFEAVQVEYNLTERTVERELVPMSEHLGLSLLAWGPLAGGLLSGKYQARSSPGESRRLTDGDRRLTERNLAIASEAARVAEELNVAPAVVALAWLRARATPPIPILGVRTAGQLEALLVCLRFELPPEALEQLDRASAYAPGYPHEFLERVRKTYPVRRRRQREEARR